DPMDANEFTTQLVQFASVEQQIAQNSNLEKLLKLEQTKVVSSLVDFIGTTIEADGRKVPLENGNAEFTYTMPVNANKATITITNSSGLTVYKADGDISAGKHTFTWDGRNNSNILQPDGNYNVLVSGLDPAGNLLDIKHTVWGRVTGANVENGNASLFIGDNISVAQDSILSVKETKAAAAN
ncbi:MAG TPA: FlgD immunoglobulin-like domain containing protein, partial [Rhodospirillales bacterium]